MLSLLQHDQSKIIKNAKNAKHDMYAFVCLLLGTHDTSNGSFSDIRWTG